MSCHIPQFAPTPKPKEFVFGSLFSGVGGLDLGLERAGMKCAWQVEFDPYCRDVLSRHWADVPKHIDVREVSKATLTPVDMICGGFPCQDISSAGRRAGIEEGTRSGLWFEYRRLINELQPNYVLIENVEALRHRSRGLGIVLSDLSTCGYDCEWDVLSAAHFGAPHLRERLFIFAHRRNLENCSASDTDREFRNDASGTTLFSRIAKTQFPEWQPEDVLGYFEAVGIAHREIPAYLRVDDGVSVGLDKATLTPAARRQVVKQLVDGTARIKGCGNAVAPPVAEFVGRCILDLHRSNWGNA